MSMELEQYTRRFAPTFNNEVPEGSFEVADEWITRFPGDWEALLRSMREVAYSQAITFYLYYDRMRRITAVTWAPAQHPYQVGVWKQAIR